MVLEGFMVMVMFERLMVMMLKRFTVSTMLTTSAMVMMLEGFMMVGMLGGFMMVTAPVRKLALATWPMVVVLIVYTNNTKYSWPQRHGRKILTNHKAQRLLLADALASDQDLINGGAFADSFATGGLPEHMRAVLGRQIAPRKHEVGNVCNLLEALLQAGKLDALGNNLGRRIVDINVAEPQVRWGILCFQVSVSTPVWLLFKGHSMLTDDKLQRAIGAFADTFIEKKLHGRAGLDRNSILLLPPGDGTVPRFNEALAED